MIYGCHCDARDYKQPHMGPVDHISGVFVDNPNIGGYTGYNCARRTCPVGNDPLNPGVNEVQTIRCNGTSTNFTITFRQETTAPIKHNATTTDVAAALERLSTIGAVEVTFSKGSNFACNATYNLTQGIQVEFMSELGSVPLMTTTPVYNVTESVKGTKTVAECADRGYCDYSTGLCKCLAGFTSSAGNNSLGNRRDCGKVDKFGYTLD